MGRVSLAATLVGLGAPAPSVNPEIKPYVISSVASDSTATPRVSNDVIPFTSAALATLD